MTKKLIFGLGTLVAFYGLSSLVGYIAKLPTSKEMEQNAYGKSVRYKIPGTGLHVLVDPYTGCQYLEDFAGITPRMKNSQQQMGCKDDT